jgi:GT2 family glycosyltransferase
MKTSVVIVSYRPGEWLAPCLASVRDQADEVVLVDNGSKGSVASGVGEQAGARVVRLPSNVGFAPAVNVAVAACRGELVGLLNDDAVAGPHWLASAAETLKDESVAAVGPKVVLSTRYREVHFPDQAWYAPGDKRPLGRQLRSVTVDGTELLEAATGTGLYRVEGSANSGPGRWRWTAGDCPWYVPVPGTNPAAEVLVNGEPAPPGRVVRLVNSAGGFLDDRGYGGDIGDDTPDDGQFDEKADRFAVSGSAFVTSKKTWAELGPFAGRFFAYYEDVDWCWRAQLAGRRIVYDPAATVEHRRSASSGGEHRPWVRVMSERNRTLTMVRNGPGPLVAKALRDRLYNGPDGGVRAGIARLLPWALATRVQMGRRREARAEAVWGRWAGVDAAEPEYP